MYTPIRSPLRGISLSVLAAALAVSAQAQTNPSADEITTVVVTGEKVSRRLKDTASSVSIKTSREIGEKTGNASVSEIISDVPNLIYTDSVSAPIIRGQDTQGPNTGQNAFWGGTVPRATINIDGHYLNYNELYFGATSVWDVRSIEVFRGPQTTSQGANAIAGAIIVNTKDPTFVPEGAWQIEGGDYNARRASLSVSGPLVGEQLAARLAVDYSARDTFIDYISSNFQNKDTDQDFETINARLKFLWQPANLPGLNAKLTYAYTKTNRPSQEASSAPFDELEHIATTMPSWKQDTHTGVFDVGYTFANGVRLFNQTQYSDSAVIRRTGLGANGEADIDQSNISNETRLTFGSEADRLSGVTGLYYAQTETDELLILSGRTTFDDTKKNLGVFGEVSFRPAERWILTGGLRYQEDKIERVGVSVFTTIPLNYNETFSAFLPKLSVAWEATPQWTIGALVSRGYNPGGVSLNLTSRQWASFDDEEIWNYELFARANLLDNRLFLSGNLFYMDFRNAQYNIPVVVSPGVVQSYTINAEEAYSYGLETSLDYRATPTLTLRASLGLLRTETSEISSNPAYAGKDFAKSPDLTLSLGATWNVTDRLDISGQVRHIDGYYSDFANTAAYLIKSYSLADIRASYRFNDHIGIHAYVRNLFDERAPTYKQQNRGIGGTEASMTAPRMFGIGLKGTF